MKRFAPLVTLALMTSAYALEPWRNVLVLGDEIGVVELLRTCQFKATVSAKGPADSLVQQLAEETPEAGGNVVHVLETSSVESRSAFRERGAATGRAFFCPTVGVPQA